MFTVYSNLEFPVLRLIQFTSASVCFHFLTFTGCISKKKQGIRCACHQGQYVKGKRAKATSSFTWLKSYIYTHTHRHRHIHTQPNTPVWWVNNLYIYAAEA